MRSSRRSAVMSMGTCVSQFIVIAAVLSVVYQLFVKSAIGISLSTASSLGASYDKGKDSRRFSSSEITGFLLFLGLFGLLRHKKKQGKKTNNEAKQKQIVKIVQSSKLGVKTASLEGLGASVTNLPCDVLYELLLFLSPRELAACPLVCRAWNRNVGNAAETLWRHVFQRDFDEAGDRFAHVFPIESWRQFYFRHHLSRAVELARLLELTHGRKCVAIKGQVYDVTDFLELHPGGPHVIADAVGTDATVIWDQFQHSNEAKRSMEQFLVWDKVLARSESEKLHGNLESVVIQWQRTSWALTHWHCFRCMAPRFAKAVFRFHSRRVTSKKSKVHATA